MLILIIYNLLDRLPNLKTFRVSIFQSILIDDIKNQCLKQINRNNSLTNLIIRIHYLKSPEELIPLFIQYCSNLKKLVIYLNPIRENISIDNMSDILFVNQYLPKLTNFHLRQCLISQNLDFLHRPYYSSPVVKDISFPLEKRFYRVFIAEHLATLWNNTA